MADACGQTKTIGQTLFLGASVVSINMNLGWGEMASSASIELVEDFQPVSCYTNNGSIPQYISHSYPDNHYYDCCSDSNGYNCPDNCYVDEYGQIYDFNRVDNNGNLNRPKEKNVPGKIYYVWTNEGVQSKYWFDQDPGFFGTGTRVNPDGTLSDNPTNVYNLINVPVFFKFDNLIFTGIIKSWDKNFNNGRNFYKIEIESISSLLKNSWMIVDGYAGAVFSYAPDTTFGAPRNYTGEGLNSIGTIRSGNIHNLFNVYGFLESLGPYGFGGSNKNDNGISYRRVLQGLQILTSSENVGDLYWKSKNMFSPFGRILGKVMQRTSDSAYTTITSNFRNYSFGVIPPRVDANGIPRVEFVLDLSELLVPPDDVRYESSNKVVRVSEFLQNLVEKNGQQSYWVSGISLIKNSLPYNVIKIKAVDRTQYSRPYAVAGTVDALRNSGFNVTSSSSGQSRNEDAKVRTVHIGGNQQRLYQAKNYRLAFNQSNYIWDPVTRKFIDYRRFDSLEIDKYKIPLGLSLRNPNVSINVLGNYHSIIDSDSLIRQAITSTSFYTEDQIWDDDIIKSTDLSCIKVLRTKDLSLDPNTGYPKESAVSTPGVTRLYSIMGDYEVSYTNLQLPSISPIDKSAKPKTTAKKDQSWQYGQGWGTQQDPTPTSSSPPPPPPPASPPPPPPPPGSERTEADQSNRFLPLHADVICPFFGFKYERMYPITGDSNIHKNIRPVWMDTWTGQICVSFDLVEAPIVSCGALISLYNKKLPAFQPKSSPSSTNRTGATSDPTATTQPGKSNPQVLDKNKSEPENKGFRTNSTYKGIGFIVTETEMRAATAGWESYLQYCIAKTLPTKPDLYIMLLNCWKNKGIFLPGANIPNTPGGGLGGPRTGGTTDPAGTLSSGPAHSIGSASIASSTGSPTTVKSGQDTKLANIDFNMLIHPGFIQDIKIIVKFIAELSQKYYGKQYMIKLPSLLSYRDQQYSSVQIPSMGVGSIAVFSGSGKLFYNYDPVDGAWEEWGSYIDNDVVVGGPYWRILANEKGLIPPILGFNASDKIDYVRKVWCALDAADKAKELAKIRNQAVDLTEELNFIDDYGLTFETDRPLSGDLSEWKIRARTPCKSDADPGTDLCNCITPIGNLDCQDPQLDEPLTSFGIYATDDIDASLRDFSYAETLLDGTETDELLNDILILDDDQLANFKKMKKLKDQAAAINASMPAGLECGAEEEIVESQEVATYPCEARQLPQDKSIDDWYVDTAAYFSTQGVPCPVVSRADTTYRSPSYKSVSTVTNNVTTIYANDASFLIPSIDYSSLNSDGSDYCIVNVDPFIDAFGSGVCGGGKKLYMKSTWENGSRIAFGEPINLTDPRAIIGISKPIYHSKTSIVYQQEPNEFVMPNVAAEDIAYHISAYSENQLTQAEKDHIEYLRSKYLSPIIAPGILLDPGSKSNPTANQRRISPKAIQPFFAAVPLKSNKYTYGPWTNYPELSKYRVFDYVDNPNSIIENLTDSIDVKYNADHVPWNYGGVSFLDKAVLYEIESNENYQIIQEKGSVRVAGPPIFNIGSYFSNDLANSLSQNVAVNYVSITASDYEELNSTSTDYIYNIVTIDDINFSSYGGYPIVQNLSISVGIEGTTSTYTLGTYNPKHGIYNKERINETRTMTKNIMDTSSVLSKAINKTTSDIRSQIYDIINDTDRYKENINASDYAPGSIFGNSPTEILIGQGRHYLPDLKSNTVDVYLSGIDSDNICKAIMNRGYRHENWAGFFTADESGPELVRDFQNKSAMSMDGIFSPVSFYPTDFNSTYPLSNLNSAKYLAPSGHRDFVTCNICQNTRVINNTYIDYSTPNRTSTQVKYPCPACCRSRISILKDKDKPKDSIDRVILDTKSKSAVINFYTLNPVVVSEGEFRNINSPITVLPSGEKVYDKHSIRVVGRGEFLPSADQNLDTTRNLTYSNTIINPDYAAYDSDASNVYNQPDNLYLLNQRFFGFRGPMMLHGWGYDTDGYPVPNLYDDPYEMDKYGRYKRFQLDANGFNDLSKEGLFISEDSQILLGDIITKRYEWKNNKWNRKSSPSKYFGSNWASKPNNWPVGPIDLRWDHQRRVWVGGGQGGCGEEKLPPYIITDSTDLDTLVQYMDIKPKNSCPYKMVYITLEQDLNKNSDVYYYSNITRGYIDDLEYKSEPLSAGFRRLVYVIDRSGYTAPAGSRLYCRYNPDLGFYEPISKPTIVTTGIIIGNQARIDLVYAKGKLSDNSPTTVINYANPLGFYTQENSIGIFSYIDGKWTLTSVN